jgi:uncharacterized protein (TIGR02001 family)
MTQSVDAGVSGYVTLGNGYWRHGLSQNDGLSIQLGIDYQRPSGFFAGGWAANVEYDLEYWRAEPRELLLDAYVGFHRGADDWSWTVMLGRYLYPDSPVSYDYNEISAGVGFRDRVFYTVSYSDDFYGRGSASSHEVSAAFPLPWDLEIGAAVGRFEFPKGRVEHTHWNVGISKVLRRIALDLRYFDSDLDRITYIGDPGADRYVLSLSYALRRNRSRT